MRPIHERLGILRGHLIVRVHDAVTGEIRSAERGSNMILSAAKSSVAQLLAGRADLRQITHVAFGSSGTAPALADAVLQDEYRRLVLSSDFPQPSQVRFRWTLLDSEANGLAIREFGLYTADGTLFSRKVRGAAIAKTDAIFLTGDWIIEQS